LTETILASDANRTETHPIPNGPAPRVSPDGSVQLLTRRRGSRELFPSSWLRTPAEVRHAGGITEGTLLEFCSTGLILQAKSHKVLVSWDAIHTVMLKEYGEWEGEEVTESLKTLETELGEVRTFIQKMAGKLRDLRACLVMRRDEVAWYAAMLGHDLSEQPFRHRVGSSTMLSPSYPNPRKAAQPLVARHPQRDLLPAPDGMPVALPPA
jgi:hypothetical protein